MKADKNTREFGGSKKDWRVRGAKGFCFRAATSLSHSRKKKKKKEKKKEGGRLTLAEQI